MAVDISTSGSAFDPFHIRLCRDIRNDLSVGFIASIRQKEPDLIASAIQRYRAMDLEPFMTAYIDDRYQRYQRVESDIDSKEIPVEDIYPVACLMWNQSLYFEFHEWLESAWHQAAGSERQILQALIRCAGVYLLLESGRQSGAKKMADKALAGLIERRSLVPKIFQVDRLIEKLSSADPVPPVLGCG